MNPLVRGLATLGPAGYAPIAPAAVMVLALVGTFAFSVAVTSLGWVRGGYQPVRAAASGSKKL